MTSKSQQNELIRELKELGRLLDRKPGTAQDEAAISNQTQLDTAELQTTSELAAPVFDPTEDVDSPETVDMFSTESLVDDPALTNNPEPETTELSHDALSGTEPLPPTHRAREQSPSPISQVPVSTSPSDAGMSRESITELSHELIDTVEKTISRRSGEPLDEALRETLLSDVSQRLSAWLENDTD